MAQGEPVSNFDKDLHVLFERLVSAACSVVVEEEEQRMSILMEQDAQSFDEEEWQPKPSKIKRRAIEGDP